MVEIKNPAAIERFSRFCQGTGVELVLFIPFCTKVECLHLSMAVNTQKKDNYFYELAAINGRHNIAAIEYEASNHQRAMKHVIILAKARCQDELYGLGRVHVWVCYKGSIRRHFTCPPKATR